jgi:single-strand selective monofunctional uracil DNA glycosylase
MAQISLMGLPRKGARRTRADAEGLIRAARRLRRAVEDLTFAPPVSYVYNPLAYAWEMHATYLAQFGCGIKRVVFLGMNPGPFGMAQTGVPFGEIAAVWDWLGLQARVGRPLREHRRRRVLGFGCHRTEVSGQRLWGLFAQRFGSPERFFAQHMVINYCPLAFVEESGRNRTPDKLRAVEQAALFAACDEHLRAVLEILQPAWLIGVGDFARRRAEHANSSPKWRVGQILHPSPASPAANRNWAAAATRQLEDLGVW